MASVYTKVWWAKGPTGRRVKHVSYGYTLMVAGRREKRFSSAWQTEAEAWAALRARQQAIEAGQLTPPATRRLGELVPEYLRYKADHGKRSLTEDRRILTTRILPAFGTDLLVKRLTADQVGQYERRRISEVSAFTVANELTVLRHMLRLARRWGYLEHVPEIELPKKPEGRQRYLEPDEITRLLSACRRSKNPRLLPIVTLALNTGMRKGEILDLAWERVDLATSRITLYRTKSGKPRGVPLNRAVYDGLVALEPDSTRGEGPVFKRRNGAAWGQIRTAFTGALKKAGISGFRFHDLRHTAASHLVMRGASLKDVQEILGHSDLKMTQRYAHLSPTHLRGAVERLEGLTAGAPLGHDLAQSGTIAGEQQHTTAQVVESSGRPRSSGG
jgi:integrase